MEYRNAGKTECFEGKCSLTTGTVIQRFGVNQNATEARYALDSEFTAALGTRALRPTYSHRDRG